MSKFITIHDYEVTANELDEASDYINMFHDVAMTGERLRVLLSTRDGKKILRNAFMCEAKDVGKNEKRCFDFDTSSREMTANLLERC